MKKRIYYLYRKAKAFLTRVLFYLMRLCPIDKDLISICAFEGKGGYGCNPKYVVEKLHEKKPELVFVWFLNKNSMDKYMPEYIRKVPNTLLNRVYWLTRSKAWIDNYRKPYGTVKRKGQYYINTNHYTFAIKTVGLYRGAGFSHMAYLVSKNDSDMMDDLVIDSKFGELMAPNGLLFNGPYLRTGAPRCDVLYGERNSLRKDYRKKKHLPKDVSILLFAPTFREGARDGRRFVYTKNVGIDFESLLRSFEDRFGGTWYLCYRLHPQLAGNAGDYLDDTLGERAIDESAADDMYEIMAACDAYLTDYSSACFEAGLAGLPVFIYADDIAEYEHDRGALFWNMTTDPIDHVRSNTDILPELDVEFPFPIASTPLELEQQVLLFDRFSYEERLKQFYNDLDVVFNGHASDDVAEHILARMKQ